MFSFLDRKVLFLGLIQSLFEGSMYVFVLEWTPALSNAGSSETSIPHGFIFAAYMVGRIFVPNRLFITCLIDPITCFL